MKTLVVYESMYGNTHRIADIVGATLTELGPVTVVAAMDSTLELVNDVDLVVVGGPTHNHSISSKRTRAQAQRMAEDDSAKLGLTPPPMDPSWEGIGVREWLRALPVSPEPIAASGGQFAACFDTRLNARALLTGRASKAIARGLTRHGFILIAEPESFLVDKHSGLPESEAIRAEHWARGLIGALQAEEAPPLDWMKS